MPRGSWGKIFYCRVRREILRARAGYNESVPDGSRETGVRAIRRPPAINQSSSPLFAEMVQENLLSQLRSPSDQTCAR